MEKLAPPLRYEFWSTECLTLSFLCGTSSSEVGVGRGMGGVVDIVDSLRGRIGIGRSDESRSYPFWMPASEYWKGMVWFAMPLCGNAHDGLADQIDKLHA